MSTNKSLLQKAKSGSDFDAWHKLVSIYEPLIVGWIARAGVRNSDIGDVAQEVLQTLTSDIQKFEHNGRTGAFRNWLKTITINRCQRYWTWKKRQLPIDAAGKIESESKILDQIADPKSEMSKLWNDEHDQFVIRKALDLVKHEFDDKTYQIFLRYGLGDEPAKSLADEFNVSIGQVYKAKFRVLDRIKTEVRDLVSFFEDQSDESSQPN